MSVKDQKAFPPINLALPDLDSNASLEALLPTLDKCRRATQFDYAVLFSLDPTRRKIDIVAQTRDAALNLYAIGDLIHSPVRDVAEDGVTVSEENISPEIDNPRFRYLHTFCHFSACLGVHVPHTVHRQYALFLFSRSERAIRPDHINYVEATSIVFGVSLERKIFQDKAKALHKAALLGHMASSLVHEINHSLSLLDPRLETQASQLEEMAEKIRSGNAVTQADLLQATANMQEARQSLSTLYNMTRLFSIPFSQKKDEYIRIDELVNLSSLLLREITKRNKVPIHLISPQELTILRGQGSLLLQVLWNVLLNAIEQISAMRPGEGGEIQVRIERPASVRNSKKLRILVEDTGPGIHRRLWENIFEAGYSTRKDGSGLGLYVSQGIIQSLGGKLYVHESFILGGTTFAIEIPQRL